MLSNDLYVFTVSPRPTLIPSAAPACVSGFFAAFIIALIGAVAASTTLTVAVQTLPSQAAALSRTLSITGLALSSAPNCADPELPEKFSTVSSAALTIGVALSSAPSSAVALIPSSISVASSAARIAWVALSSAVSSTVATSPSRDASASPASLISMVALSSALNPTTASLPFRAVSESPTSSIIPVALLSAPTSTSEAVPSRVAAWSATSLRVPVAALFTPTSTLGLTPSRDSAWSDTRLSPWLALSSSSISILCALSNRSRRRCVRSHARSNAVRFLVADCTPALVRSTASIGISIVNVSATFYSPPSSVPSLAFCSAISCIFILSSMSTCAHSGLLKNSSNGIWCRWKIMCISVVLPPASISFLLRPP